MNYHRRKENAVKKPDILKSELEQTVENSEPKLKQFKPRIELTDADLEKVSGGNTRCGIYVS